MYLSVQNQLTLLQDLLDDHVTYKTVTVDEYRQIKKLVQAIMTNRNVKGELLNVLPEIYYYGIKGENAQSLAAHIVDHEQKIRQWVMMINQVRLNVSS